MFYKGITMKFNEDAFSLKYNDCTFTFILKDAHHYYTAIECYTYNILYLWKMGLLPVVSKSSVTYLHLHQLGHVILTAG